MDIARFPQPFYTLHPTHYRHAPVVADLALLSLVADAHAHDRVDELVDLYVTGQVAGILPDEPVTILDDALTAVLVEATDGSGRSGWAPTAWLRPHPVTLRGAA